jgi:hypothetical protein
VITNSEVQVPPDLAKILEKKNIQHLDTFLTMLWAFPKTFANELSWEIEQVRHAYNQLASKANLDPTDYEIPNDGC